MAVETALHALYTESQKKIRHLAMCHEDQFSLLVCVCVSICQSSVGACRAPAQTTQSVAICYDNILTT